ncbi:GSK-3-binding protein-like [Pelodytes ibericus]
MPCRKESFLLLEQSVTVGSQEVDTLVARIGEALQLNAQRAPASRGMPYTSLKPPPAISRSACTCVRGRATPYPVCTPRVAGRYSHQHSVSKHQEYGGSKQLCGRGWIRGSCRKHGHSGADNEEEDPHRLLQELLLSGNLIKEAVRRLHMVGETPSSSDGSVQSAETIVQ